MKGEGITERRKEIEMIDRCRIYLQDINRQNPNLTGEEITNFYYKNLQKLKEGKE